MKLDLYIMRTCPYCRRVLNFIEDQNIKDIEFHDINASAEDERYLIEKGGMRQVPCLFIDGKPMYESLDIIHWLDVNVVNAEG